MSIGINLPRTKNSKLNMTVEPEFFPNGYNQCPIKEALLNVKYSGLMLESQLTENADALVI